MAQTSGNLVVDTSVAVKWYLRDEELLIQADRFLADWTGGRWLFVAPGHFPYGLTNAILRAGRRQRPAVRRIEDAMKDIAVLIRTYRFIDPSLILPNSVQLAEDLGVSFFDAYFLSIARMEGCSLITADRAFYRQTQSQPDVLWLGNY
jgi:predicted nucleic acid-binding protein